jgi:hypothetical protein
MDTRNDEEIYGHGNSPVEDHSKMIGAETHVLGAGHFGAHDDDPAKEVHTEGLATDYWQGSAFTDKSGKQQGK